MSRLIKIASSAGAPRASVIFVHGLGGHAYDTWRRDIEKKAGDDASFWPLWLAQDVEGITVYTLAYEAPASNWLGTSMPLQDRAVNVLEVLLSEPALKSGPIVFICHSLGGLIVKQLLLELQQQKDRRKDAKDLLNRVTQIVFAATPHTGSRHASLLDRLRFFAWPSTIARTLAANDPTLRAINVAYRGFADERRDVLKHRVFYETQGTPLGVIVDEASSDPGLPGDPPVPIDATHISIVKPVAPMSVLYARTRDFVAAGAPALAGESGALEILALPPVRSEQPLNLIPKLIRIAAIGFVALVGFRGVQALIAPPPIDRGELVQLHEEVQQLTKQLIALTAARAGPGAQQAVGQAVQSIALGAEAGDSRLEKALGLLKEIKLAEATQLLTAFAGDKEARAENATVQAEKDRKEAAVAYRNLGAIAGLADPKRALEAYEKALALDPDDIQSLFWTGWIQISYGDLDKAQTRLERVLKLPKTGDEPFYKYWALTGLGDVLVAQGNLPEALKSYQDGLTISDRLAKSDPGNAQWQYDLGISNERVGNVQMAQGDLIAALRSYETKRDIISRLAKSDPGNALWQRDLSVSNERVGDVFLAQGNLPAALEQYRASLDRMVPIRDSDPSNADLQRFTSVTLRLLANVCRRKGDKETARDYLRQGQEIMARLTKLSPDNAQWKHDLAAFNSGIAELDRDTTDVRPSPRRSKRR
jgi:tetratricopeptide (TPR) repeat protein/pimeloyl-ACP methyl ester carboxylesterase